MESQTQRPREYTIAIVGGGPLCTYALDRLSALLANSRPKCALRVVIFERSGRFGAGEVHNDNQATTSYMNRSAGQITFGADESNVQPSALLPASLRLNFIEWCREKYSETGLSDFFLTHQDVPKRYIHGLALRAAFERYVNVIREVATVDVHAAEVIDVAPRGNRSRFLLTAEPRGFSVEADFALFVTGHSRNRPEHLSLEGVSSSLAEKSELFGYVAYPYPLDSQLCESTVQPGSAVGIRGLGLAAIDVMHYLTEGRGGRFVDQVRSHSSGLRYVPSGREPKVIIAASPSGLLPYCRAINVKQSRTEDHDGVFFSLSTVRCLRRNVGMFARLPNGRVQRQLNFENHLFPILILEMAYVYYRTLLGREFAQHIKNVVKKRFLSFIQTGCTSRDAGIEYLLEPVQKCFDEASDYFSCTFRRVPVPTALQKYKAMDVVSNFFSAVSASVDLANRLSPDKGPGQADEGYFGYRDPNVLSQHRFDWRQILDPFLYDPATHDWQSKLVGFIQRDLRAAAEGNLKNPLKAACEGVWRDLRAVLCESVDNGGLLADSHRRFTSIYLRYCNRLSNGACLASMRKVLALIECGMLDLSVGPLPIVDRSQDSVCLRGSVTGVSREINVLVDARVEPFNAERDHYPLYSNLMRRGIVRLWRNPSCSVACEDFVPGGLDLSDCGHPIGPDGELEKRLTFLGAAFEGVRYFQMSAARPNSNNYVLNNIVRWADELFTTLSSLGVTTRHKGASSPDRVFPLEGHQ